MQRVQRGRAGELEEAARTVGAKRDEIGAGGRVGGAGFEVCDDMINERSLDTDWINLIGGEEGAGHHARRERRERDERRRVRPRPRLVDPNYHPGGILGVVEERGLGGRLHTDALAVPVDGDGGGVGGDLSRSGRHRRAAHCEHILIPAAPCPDGQSVRRRRRARVSVQVQWQIPLDRSRPRQRDGTAGGRHRIAERHHRPVLVGEPHHRRCEACECNRRRGGGVLRDARVCRTCRRGGATVGDDGVPLRRLGRLRGSALHRDEKKEAVDGVQHRER